MMDRHPTSADEWVDVATASAEMGLSSQALWACMKRWGVRVTHPHQMSRARFTRAEFEAKRDAGLQAPPPAAPRAVRARASGEVIPAPARTVPADYAAKLKAFKSGKAR